MPSTLQLREYQHDLIDGVRYSMRTTKRNLMVAPTGAGKTALAVTMMAGARDRGLVSFFLVHQNELLAQTSRALWSQRLEHGIIKSGRVIDKNVRAYVASVQTLVRRLDSVPEPQLIIIDECHRSLAKSYTDIIERWPNAYVVGLTATPQRTDGRGLGDVYDKIIEGPTIRTLMADGWLCDYELFAPPQLVDLASIPDTAGDFSKSALEEAMQTSSITGDAVDTYKRQAYGKRCVVMCATVNHAHYVADAYRAQNVTAEALEGKMTDSDRAAVLERFKSGQTKVVTNCQLLIEGFDLPAIEVVQWLRPTKSLIIWMQGNGRGLRPHDGKEKLILLDHVGNWARHGMPCTDRTWSLDSAKRGKRSNSEPDMKVNNCSKCYAVFNSDLTACPYCGEVVPPSKVREIEQVDGDLVKVDKTLVIKERKKEQGSARTLDELVMLGVRREMKAPAAWAAQVFAGRSGRKPTAVDFAQAKAVLLKMEVHQ